MECQRPGVLQCRNSKVMNTRIFVLLFRNYMGIMIYLVKDFYLNLTHGANF